MIICAFLFWLYLAIGLGVGTLVLLHYRLGALATFPYCLAVICLAKSLRIITRQNN